MVYFSLGEAVYKVPLHIGGSHSALLSRHPDIRKRQSAVITLISSFSHVTVNVGRATIMKLNC